MQKKAKTKTKAQTLDTHLRIGNIQQSNETQETQIAVKFCNFVQIKINLKYGLTWRFYLKMFILFQDQIGNGQFGANSNGKYPLLNIGERERIFGWIWCLDCVEAKLVDIQCGAHFSDYDEWQIKSIKYEI